LRVLLALPPETHNLEVYRILGARAPPLGLAWIGAVLERAGCKVKIIDSPTLRLSLRDFIHEVKSWSPDLVGISVITPTAYRAYKAVKLLRQELPKEVPIVAGGPHVTFMYEEALNEGFDVVVCGEGELTTLELVKVIEERGCVDSYLREVRGLAFRDLSGKIVKTPPRPPIEDLDQLPWPTHHLLPMDAYTIFNKPTKVAHVIASRGCPYGCVFCSTSYFWGRKVRFRSAKNVADEVEFLTSKYKVKRIAFMDDELTASRVFINGFINEIKERGLDIEFSCGSRVDHVDRDLIRKLRDSGCKALYFGVESSSQRTLDRIGKRITVDQVVKVFNWVKELGVYAVGTFILGFPWETLEDMRDTVEFAIKLDPSYAQFTIATPYPGTPLYEYAVKNNLIVDSNWEHYTTLRPVMRGHNFSTKDVARMLARAYRKFYLRLKFLGREIREGRFHEITSIVVKGLANWFDDMKLRFSSYTLN